MYPADWIPFTIDLISFAVIVALAFGKYWLAPLLTGSLELRFNKKIESLKAELRAKELEIEALRSGALVAMNARKSAVFDRRIEAIDELWEAIETLGRERPVLKMLEPIRFEIAAKDAETKLKVRKVFQTLYEPIKKNQKKEFNSNKFRPYITARAWYSYQAYRMVISEAHSKFAVLISGVGPKVLKPSRADGLLSTLLPHHRESIEKYGLLWHDLCLVELETILLDEIKAMLSGKAEDEETMDQAKAINESVTQLTIDESLIQNVASAKIPEKYRSEETNPVKSDAQ